MRNTLIRSILKIGAGALVTKGIVDEGTTEIIIAGLTALISVLWGLFDRTGKVPTPPVTCLAFTFAVCAFLCGCGSTPQAVAYNSLADVRAVVDRAEKLYGREVALGNVSDAKQAEIDDVIRKFHASFLVAVRAARSDYSTPASPDLDRLAESLVKLIETLTAKSATRWVLSFSLRKLCSLCWKSIASTPTNRPDGFRPKPIGMKWRHGPSARLSKLNRKPANNWASEPAYDGHRTRRCRCH